MIISIEGLQETFEMIDHAVIEKPKEVVVAVTEDVYKNARNNIIPHSKSGRMENNLQFRVHIAKLEGEVYIDNQGMMVDWKGKPTNYALFVHFGTKAHKITPTKKKALRWIGVGGFWFSKGHEVKGIKADPFMYNASKKTFNNLDKIFTRVYNGL